MQARQHAILSEKGTRSPHCAGRSCGGAKTLGAPRQPTGALLQTAPVCTSACNLAFVDDRLRSFSDRKTGVEFREPGLSRDLADGFVAQSELVADSLERDALTIERADSRVADARGKLRSSPSHDLAPSPIVQLTALPNSSRGHRAREPTKLPQLLPDFDCILSQCIYQLYSSAKTRAILEGKRTLFAPRLEILGGTPG